MTQNKKYLLWNNKGGVGKTFLSYTLAVEYAIRNPDEDVVLVDACPQTNVSEIVLGGNGLGAENVNQLTNSGLTIAGYIKERFTKGQQERIGTETNFFVQAATYNQKMPTNLYLLCGDMDLDICSKLINHMGTSPVRKAWERSRMLINDLITSFEASRQTSGRKQVFFIDCNPSFSNYTENAILASNRIIVPCTADAASIRGIKNLFNLIFNVVIENQKLSDEFEDFYHDTQKTALTLPKVHLFVQNRSRSQSKDAAIAFQSHAEEINRVVQNVITSHPDRFTEDPIQQRVVNVKDGNTLAAIINHEGCPLSSLQHKTYSIYGQNTQASNQQISALKRDVDHLLGLI